MEKVFKRIKQAYIGPRYHSIPKILAKAEVGDVIAFDRVTYQHYVLYVGDGNAVNIGAERKESSKAPITVELVADIAGESKARIANQDYAAKYGFGRKPLRKDIIVAKVWESVGETLPYDYFVRNCEYYCNLWRYGVGFCTQASAKSFPSK